jgi:hypothetical protein
VFTSHRAEGIISLDILESLEAHVDLENRKLRLLDASEHKRSSLKTETYREQGESIRASLTVRPAL